MILLGMLMYSFAGASAIESLRQVITKDYAFSKWLKAGLWGLTGGATIIGLTMLGVIH